MITRSKSKQISNMPLNRTPIFPVSSGSKPQNNNVSLLDLDVQDLNKSIGLENATSMEENPFNPQTASNCSEDLDAKITRVATNAVSSALAGVMENLTLTLSNKFEAMLQQNQISSNKPPARTSSPIHKENNNDIQQFNKIMENYHNNKSNAKSSLNAFQDKSKIASNIARWNIKFDGDRRKMTVNQFLFRISKLQNSYGYTEEQIFDNFHLLIEGQVQNWFWNYSSTHPFLNYDDLINAMKQHYDSTESELELVRKLYEVKQKDSDSFDYFYNEILRRNSFLPNPKSDHELTEIIYHNVKPALKQMIFGSSFKAKTLNDLVFMCRSAESLIRSNPQNFPKSKPNINEIESTQEINLENDSIDALNKNQKFLEYQCKNCTSRKHPQTNSLHCFKCGLENTISSDCPRCNQNKN